MKGDAPPRWMEWVLLAALPMRLREPVAGDLLEEYRQEQLPRLGRAGADVWYLRQLVSFVVIRMAGGVFMKGVLLSFCCFNVTAGSWLGVMEQVLRHDGYAGRTAIAACIVLQALLTIAVVLARGRLPLVYLVEGGAVVMMALYRIATAPHFEGFVVIIGAALIVQGALTLMTLLPKRYVPT